MELKQRRNGMWHLQGRLSNVLGAQLNAILDPLAKPRNTSIDDPARRWQAVPISARREVARMLLAPEMIGELRVTPRPPGWPGGRHIPASERVILRRS